MVQVLDEGVELLKIDELKHYLIIGLEALDAALALIKENSVLKLEDA